MRQGLWRLEDQLATKWRWYEEELGAACSAAEEAAAAATRAQSDRDKAWDILAEGYDASEA